jgi:PLD-like domain
MSIRLVYHPIEGNRWHVSPFDEAIVQMARNKDVLIACPYIGLGYIERIISICNSVLILSDFEAWLSSNDDSARLQIVAFMDRHAEIIRHIGGLHSKVVIASDKALVGSANFTNAGITRSIEMSVLFTGEPQVEEARRWFDSLWKQSISVSAKHLEEYLEALPPKMLTYDGPRGALTSPPLIQSKLVEIQPRTQIRDKKELGLLIERVGSMLSRQWASQYFDVVNELLQVTGLSGDDPRLALTIPYNNWQHVLPVIINNRYVLASWRWQGKPMLGVIMGPEFDHVRKPYFVLPCGPFHALPQERARMLPTPCFARIAADDMDKFLASQELKESWLDASLREVGRAVASTFRRFHRPNVYEAVVNLDFRNTLLDRAFTK